MKKATQTDNVSTAKKNKQNKNALFFLGKEQKEINIYCFDFACFLVLELHFFN